MKKNIFGACFLLLFSLAAMGKCGTGVDSPNIRSGNLTQPQKFIIAWDSRVSPTMLKELNEYKPSINAGDATYTENPPPVIVLNQFDPLDYQETVQMLTGLAHELGHLKFGSNPKPPDYGTKAKFIDVACNGEGYAVYNNIVIVDELRECNIDIRSRAGTRDALRSIYDKGGSGVYQKLGDKFCDVNTTSFDNRSYRDYYGDLWDDSHNEQQRMLLRPLKLVQNKAQTTGSNQTIAPQKVRAIATAVLNGPTALYDVWPNGQLSRPSGDIGAPYLRQRGGSFALGKNLVVTHSQLIWRTDKPNSTVAILKVGGVCATLDNVSDAFGRLTSGGGRPATGQTFWIEEQGKAEIRFTFGHDRPGCLQEVRIYPKAALQ